MNAQDAPEELVEVPAWGVTVLVRGLSGKERAKFQEGVMTRQPGAPANAPMTMIRWDRLWAELCILTMRDPETKELIFEQTDRDMLLSKAAANLETVSAVARRLSGLLDEQAPSKSDGAADGE
jgi:hypothetical protein